MKVVELVLKMTRHEIFHNVWKNELHFESPYRKTPGDDFVDVVIICDNEHKNSKQHLDCEMCLLIIYTELSQKISDIKL